MGMGMGIPPAESAWGRRERARYYRALANALGLSGTSVAGSIAILREMPLAGLLLPAHVYEVDQQIDDWLAGGEQPSLSEVLLSLFGVGFCFQAPPKIPACMAFYVRDSDAMRQSLRDLYDNMGYNDRRVFAPQCEGTGYIAQQLEFAAHCLERSESQECDLEQVSNVLRDSLIEWAPLFARALVASRAHPAAVFVGVRLELLLAHEQELGGAVGLSRATPR